MTKKHAEKDHISKIHISEMALLGTKSVQTAFALMAEATRRAGEYGNYNSFIRAIPSIPHLAENQDPAQLGADLPKTVKFLIFQYLTKSGKFFGTKLCPIGPKKTIIK